MKSPPVLTRLNTASSPFHRFIARAALGKASLIFSALLCFSACAGPSMQSAHHSSASPAPAPAPGAPREKILLGIDALEQKRFRPLQGKRVGLLTHPAGVNRDGVSSIDVLRRSPQVRLVALFGPEHGIYGDEKANVPVDDRTDPRTGLPVYSLYGKYRKPTPQMLRGLDTLVIDLQDLGVRSYTYVSAMRRSMEACFEAGVEVVVLDRPNPLGGLKVDGPPMDKRWMSYVGAYRVPYVHGLTIAELARMAKARPGWLEVDEAVRKAGKLRIVRMKGWRRSMMWPETGLRWVPTSPAIPDLSAAMGYAMTGLGAQLGGFSHGYGKGYPFRLLTYAGRSAADIKTALEARRIPGLDYKILPYHTAGGRQGQGVYLLVTDWRKLRPTEISFHMMQLACAWESANPFAAASVKEAGLFNKHTGSTAWWNALTTQGESIDLQSFLSDWERQARAFKQDSRVHWLYY